MTNLETQLRESLRHIAGESGVRVMPPATLGRIRRRQAGVATGIAALVVVVLLGGTGLMRVMTREDNDGPVRPADGTQWYEESLGAVPEGWPQIRLSEPHDAYISEANSKHVVGTKHVIASGTVAGSAFSFVAWTANGGACGDGPSLELAGPAPIGKSPAAAVATVGCASDDGPFPVPTGADLKVLGQGEGSLPELEASFGFVSGRVARLEVTMSDGAAIDIPILDGPGMWDVRTFLVFPPQGDSEDLVAYDREGRALARAPLCRNEGISNSCRNPTMQLVPTAPA